MKKSNLKDLLKLPPKDIQSLVRGASFLFADAPPPTMDINEAEQPKTVPVPRPKKSLSDAKIKL